jgi:hypothetical protein
MLVCVSSSALVRSYPRAPRAATGGWAPPLLATVLACLPFAICVRAHGGCHAQRDVPVQAIALPAHVQESGGYRRVRLDVHGSAAVLIS